MKRLAAALGGVLAIGVGILSTPRLLRTISVFDVRRVEIVGAHFLDPAGLTRRLGLEVGASIFDPTDSLARRVFAVVGVARVEIRRRLPGTLIVEIDERRPVALTTRDGRLVLLDARARLLPYDPTLAEADLPIAEADSAVLAIIERVRIAAPALFSRIVSAEREPNAVVLETKDRRLLLRPDATPREIENLGLVLDEVGRRKMAATEFDARFDGRVIVRGGRRT